VNTKATPSKSRAARPCPICNKMSVDKFHPFCSDRCANIDLHRWLGGNYRIPSREPADFAESEVDREDGAED